MAEDLELAGPAAPPRRNGELVFAEPWESRVFGLTMTLHEAGVFSWDEFRSCLIDEIRRGETVPESPGYWRSWQRAIESVLDAKGVCASRDLEQRTQTLAARLPGHDHH
jgi:nitrile hydratase accessory protein